MNILTLFVVIPVLTVVGILFTKDLKQSRLVSAIGMTLPD
jgi:NADH-quinone oxidoreductase subunit M